jgi:hypothetical protein
MKKSIVLISIPIVMIAFWIGLFTYSYSDEYYDIKSYEVSVIVHEDNTYDIIETITVSFTEPRHGIYRDIPLKHYGYVHDITDVQVYNSTSGKPYTTKISKSNGNLSIRIGDEDDYVSGVVSYVISYNYDMGYDGMDDQDEFYFNLIGTDWDTLILDGTFSIQMPKDFDKDKVSVITGYEGDTATMNAVYEVQGNVITGSLTSPLLAYQGLTIAIPLVEGYYQNVSDPPSVVWVQVIAGLMAIFSVISLYYNIKYKRDNTIVPIVGFEPPEGINAAEVAYIHKREKVNNTDLSTLVLEWASRGYLTISDDPIK